MKIPRICEKNGCRVICWEESSDAESATTSETEIFGSPPLAPPKRGCCNPLASNFDKDARIDDGSCVYISTLQPPVADAGVNQLIVQPADTVTLDSSGSYDPNANGFIVSRLWQQISGAPITITSDGSVITTATGLNAVGVYIFSVTVTNNYGLTNTDATLTITVVVAPNNPPIADAGANQTIMQPASSFTLDSSGSYDPDGTIVSRVWTLVSGDPCTIVSPNSVSTLVTGANTTGDRIFQVFITDNLGATDYDVVVITVVPDSGGITGRLHIDTSSPQVIQDILGVTDVNINSNRKVRDDAVWLSLRNALLLKYTEAPDAGSLMAWSHVSAHVQLATTANITLSGEQIIDGVLTNRSSVFTKEQTDGTEIGIYISGAGAWTRRTDFDSNADVMRGLQIKTLPTTNNGTNLPGGLLNGGKVYEITTPNPIVIGTTALTFATYNSPYSDGYDFDDVEGTARGFDITQVNSGSYTGVLNNTCRGWTYWDEAVLDMQLLKGSKMVIVANMISPLIPEMSTPRPLDFNNVNVDRVVAEICYKISTCRAAGVEIDSIQLGYENGTANDVYLQAYFDDYYNLCNKVIGILEAKYPDIPVVQLLSGDTPSSDVSTGVAVAWRTLNAPLNAIVQEDRCYQQYPAYPVTNLQQYIDRSDELSNILNLFQSQAISAGLQMGMDQVELAPAESGLPYSVRQKVGEGIILSYLFMLMVDENIARSNIIRRVLLATSHLVAGSNNNIQPLYYFVLLIRNMFRNWGRISATYTNVVGSNNLLTIPVSVQNNFIHLELLSPAGITKTLNFPEFFTEALGIIIDLQPTYQTDGTDQIILTHLVHSDEFLNRIALANSLNFPYFFSARTTEIDTWVYINRNGQDQTAVQNWLKNVVASQFTPMNGGAIKETLNPNTDVLQKIAWEANPKSIELYIVNFSGTDVIIPETDVNGTLKPVSAQAQFGNDPTDAIAQSYLSSATAVVTIKKWALEKLIITNVNF